MLPPSQFKSKQSDVFMEVIKYAFDFFIQLTEEFYLPYTISEQEAIFTQMVVNICSPSKVKSVLPSALNIPESDLVSMKSDFGKVSMEDINKTYTDYQYVRMSCQFMGAFILKDPTLRDLYNHPDSRAKEVFDELLQQ